MTTTSYIQTLKPIFTMHFDDARLTLTNYWLDDNPWLPDIVCGTDPGWALLTYDEYYDRNPHLKMYTAPYKETVVPAAPSSQAAPAPSPTAG